MIQFILNQTLIQLDNFQAETTLLDYLRLNADLKGTKEGCASGDCGACTVVIASVNARGDALEYKSINSCICLLGSLHGKQLITIDGMQKNYSKEQQGGLHPIQQTLVDHHASQCGFCTPGFVMSLFAMSKQNIKYSRNDIIENIDGNLCRCTGYRPIIDAAQTVLSQSYQDDFDHNSQVILEQLKAIQAAQSDYFILPENISELTQAIADNPQAQLLAGGTDLVLNITQGLQKLDKVIYLGNVKELKKLEQRDNKLIVGAVVPYHDLVSKLAEQYPTLKKHLARLGSPQIRNMGTLGGNIANASPIADMPPVLMALNADLMLQKGANKRLVSINDFYIGYKQTVMEAGEFIRDIQIPTQQSHHYLYVYKISKRYADDISAVCGAFHIHFNQGKILSARIAFGGMAATPKRATHCEKVLHDQKLDNNVLERAQAAILNDFEPMDDVRASRDYRLKMAQNCLQQCFLELESLFSE